MKDFCQPRKLQEYCPLWVSHAQFHQKLYWKTPYFLFCDLWTVAYQASLLGIRIQAVLRGCIYEYGARKVSRATDGWTGGSQSDFTWKGWGSFSSPWKIYCSRIRLANWLKSARSWRLIRFSFVTGVGINLRPRDSRVICSSTVCLTQWRHKSAFCLWFFSALFFCGFWPLCYLCGLLSLFPLLLRSLIRDKSKIHFVYSHTLVISFVLTIHRLR